METNRKTRVPSSEERHAYMTKTPIPKLVTLLAIPTVLTQIITVVYNSADAYYVSKISTEASAAVGVAFSLMSLIQAFGAGISMGCLSLISRKLGGKENGEAESTASNGCLEALVVGGLLCFFGLTFLEPLMRLFGSTEAMLPHTCAYAAYVLSASPVMCFSFVLMGILRAEGEAKFSMISAVSGGLLNVILDPLFIFDYGLGMGTGGAGLATAISQTVTMLISLSFFLAKKSIVRPSPKKLSKRFRDYADIIATGLPTVFRQGLAALSSALLNVSAKTFSDTPEAAIAGISIANKVYLWVRNVILGIGQGFQPVAGYNFGAGDKKRTRQAFVFSCALGSVFCASAAGIIALFPERVIAFFRDDPDIIGIGVPALLYGCAVMPFMAFSTYVNQLYQTLGFKVRATVLASCRQGICFVPLILILPRFFGIDGVGMTQPGADLMTFVVSIPFCVYFFKKTIDKYLPKR